MSAVNLRRRRVHGGDPGLCAPSGDAARAPSLDFSIDVNPFGPPASVPDIIRDHIDDLLRYPDPRATALRQALAAHHRVPVDAILPGNGSAELIGLLVQFRPATRALIAVPTFTEYEWALEQRGVACTVVCADEADRFQWDWTEAAWRARLDGVNLVFLCNPNNPTGVVVSRAQVLLLARWCRDAGALLIVDEAFADFVDDPHHVSVIDEAGRHESLVVLRSLTKLFAVPGLRLGYLVGPPHLVEAMRSLQQPWPLNALALAVGARLVEEREYIDRSRAQIRRLRERLSHQLGALPGLDPLPPSANFIFCKLTETCLTSSQLVDAMAARGLLLRNCDDFTGLESGRFIRIAVLQEAANARLLSALRTALTDARSEVLQHDRRLRVQG